MCAFVLALTAISLHAQQLPVRRLAPDVYAVIGDTGRGSEGRPNAGFVVTADGVVVIDALASPAQGEALVRTVGAVTDRPIRWLVLTHHHPDHHFGAIALRRAGARVIAHPDVSTGVDEQSREAGESAWTRVVGKEQMKGFAYADVPDVPVTTADTLRLGGETIVIAHPWQGPAHTAGDLIIWLPAERV
ncbi:MAG TPA: MBL fold metallo-hydrolase, partial [Gemmatimonadales bacterium]|nr:MBL fold metallo-hydrolase [Gemmatimonadales bacterium]